MDFDQDKLNEFRDNPKTQFLAGQFERDLERLREAEQLADGDAEMAELAKEEISSFEE